MRTKEAMEAEFMELVKQLDDVETQAFIVWAETALAGGSTREATERAEAFFLAHPGYERQAKVMHSFAEADDVQTARALLHIGKEVSA